MTEASSANKSYEMNDEQIIQLARNLFEQTMKAKSYWSLIQQYHKYTDNYLFEMQCSSAFYLIIHQALTESLIMSLAKIYEDDNRVISMYDLASNLRHLKVDSLHDDIKNSFKSSPPDAVDLFLKEKVKLYQTRFRKLRNDSAIKNLKEQRNKIYAHNDSVINFDSQSIYSEFPLKRDDIKQLLEFAIDCTQFVIEVMTGVHTIPEYINIKDWERTLELVHIGQMYQDQYLEDTLFNN